MKAITQQYPSKSLETIKYIAILLMVVDHINAYFFDGYGHENIITAITRMTFPLFVFMLTYNYLYNSKHKKRYIQRMIITAILSQIPYMLVFQVIIGHFTTNVLFTLSAGLIFLWSTEQKREGQTDRGLIALVIAGFSIVSLLFFDYGIQGFLLTVAFYLYLNNPSALNIASLVIATMILNQPTPYLFSSLGALMIIWYFRKEGRGLNLKRIPGIYFYAFYPIHLLLIWGIGQII